MKCVKILSEDKLCCNEAEYMRQGNSFCEEHIENFLVKKGRPAKQI